MPESSAKRWIALCLAFCFLFLVACDEQRGEAPKIADYGPGGADFAVQLATTYPSREAGSGGEEGAANLIEQTFRDLGYAPQRQTFELPNGGSSQNILVKIPGNGFTYTPPEEGENLQMEENRDKLGQDLQATVLVAATYNTPSLDQETIATGNFNGISDNASGVGALMMLAKQLKNYRSGYDIILVALGGTNQNYAGARALYNGLSESTLDTLDCFYEIRNIYAGTKLYAHSGWSSLLPNQKYEMRRRAYAMTDVAIEYGLIETHGTDLYLNEAGFNVPSPISDGTVIYREFTLTPSNYRVFDEQGIPIVYFEAYDYNGKDLDSLSETRSPDFAETNGKVGGTKFDNASYLNEVLEEGQLEERINLMAFILAEGLMKNPPDTEQRMDALQSN